MKVKECMCTEVKCAKSNETVNNVAKLMLENHVGSIPICNDDNKIVGIITDRDILLRAIACDKDVKQIPISEIMTTEVYHISPEANISDASKLMCDCQVRRVPVVENNQAIGIISLGDLANNQKISENEVAKTVEKICNCGCNCKNAE